MLKHYNNDKGKRNFRDCSDKQTKKQTGDYQTLAKALNTTVDAVRMRISRGDENTHKILMEIIENREELIKKKSKSIRKWK